MSIRALVWRRALYPVADQNTKPSLRAGHSRQLYFDLCKTWISGMAFQESSSTNSHTLISDIADEAQLGGCTSGAESE